MSLEDNGLSLDYLVKSPYGLMIHNAHNDE